VVAVMGAVLALTAVTAAHAAPPYETEATLTDVSFVSQTVESGKRTELTGSWSLPNNPSTPAGFVVDLPAELSGLTDSFDLRDPSGEVMGHCVVTKTQVVCDLDSDYIAEHPRNLKGSFGFWVDVKTEVTESTDVTYDFGDVDASITVTPPAGTCPNCSGGMAYSKTGTYDRENDTIRWGVGIKAPRGGMAGGQEVSVVERLGANQEWARTAAGDLDIYIVGTDQADARGVPTGWKRVTARVGATITETAGGVVITFTSEAGWYYAVHGNVKVTDGGRAGTYTNDADITIEGQTTRTVTGTVVRQGGGGTGSGDKVGQFSITKDVVWSDAAIPGLTFGGTYTVTAPNGDVVDGTFEVAEDQTWTSPEYDAGSIVHIVEVVPTAPANIDWAEPSFSQNDFALGDDSTVAVTLTNEATLARGLFSAAKVITGTGAERVPTDATFTLAYEYPAGDGFAAGSGTLVLPADGTVVSSDLLPVGAELSLSEVTPSPVDGATWEQPQLSTTTLTIGRDAEVRVTVTNTLTVTPTPTPTPTPSEPTPTDTPTPTPTKGVGSEHTESPTPAPTPSGSLAVTGGQTPFALLTIGVVLLALGVVAQRRAARRSSDTSV
jgi:uncharacterized surface anchored protein